MTLDPDRPARQRTIEATIDWSHRRLSAVERRDLRRLAVFRGTFGVAEAQRLLTADGRDAVAVSGTLGSLVECSMVAAAPPLQDAARLRLVEPIRAFALRQLELADEHASARAQHSHVFVGVARDVAPGLFGRDEQVSLERLEADHDNLRAALGWLIESGDGAQALGLIGKLWWLWFSHGHLAEGSQWVRRALDLGGGPSRERVRALRAGSHLAWWQGDYARSYECNVELERCAAEIGDAWGLAWAPMGHGAVELFRDPRKALSMFEDSRRRFENLGLDWEAGYALQVIGGSLWFAGMEEAALRAFEEAVAIFERLAHRSVLASVQRSAGLMAARCGDAERGGVLCRAALQTSAPIDDRAGSAQALNFLAAIKAIWRPRSRAMPTRSRSRTESVSCGRDAGRWTGSPGSRARWGRRSSRRACSPAPASSPRPPATGSHRMSRPFSSAIWRPCARSWATAASRVRAPRASR